MPPPPEKLWVGSPGGFISKSGWESDFDLKNWLFFPVQCLFAPKAQKGITKG